jgi:hypothetical protein
MKKMSIFISIGLFSALSETSLACNSYPAYGLPKSPSSYNPYFSSEYRGKSHRVPAFTPHLIYLLFQMMYEYGLPSDSLSQWTASSVQSWEKVYSQYPEMREKYQKLFQRYTLAGLKEEADLIGDALQKPFTLNRQDGSLGLSLGLPVDSLDFAGLPPQILAFLEAMLRYTRDWYNERIYIE